MKYEQIKMSTGIFTKNNIKFWIKQYLKCVIIYFRYCFLITTLTTTDNKRGYNMGNINRLRIPIHKIKAGMILADDIYTPKGLMLIPRLTTIDDKHIFRIKLYQISTVVIQTTDDDEKIDDTLIQEQILSSFNSTVTQNFTDFKNRYHIHHDRTIQQLNNISSGKPIDTNELYAVSDILIASLRTKSDLFNYLYHLREEDDYTYTHCLNVSILANVFAKWLHLEEDQIKEITIAGMLHDIGKILVDHDILNKPGKLTEQEFDHIKKHCEFGYETIKDQDLSENIKNSVLMHHEKLNGSGYPLGLHDEQIPLYAKIIGIVDIYDAMTSNRSYHDKFSPFKVIRMFEEESYGLLDTKLLFVFLENIAYNYLGRDVLLSTGEKARIVFIHNQSPSRPIVEINQTMIDLMFKPDILIVDIL